MPFGLFLLLSPYFPKIHYAEKNHSFKQNCKILHNGQKLSTILAEWIKSVQSRGIIQPRIMENATLGFLRF